MSNHLQYSHCSPFGCRHDRVQLHRGAAEHQGSRLGEFVRAGEFNGRPFYKQRDTEGEENTFLFSEGGIWVVGQSLGGPTGLLANVQDTDLPPRANWLYVHGTDGNRSWRNNDQTLKLEYTTLSSPCRLVRVAGSGSVLIAQWNTIGIYRFAYITLADDLQCITSTRCVIICKTSSDCKKDVGAQAGLCTRKAADQPQGFCS